MPKLTKTRLAIPAVIVLLVVAAGGAQLWAEDAAKTRLDATLASLPQGATGHYDQMGFNLFTRTLRIGGLTVTQNGHPRLAAQRIVLHHLGGAGDAASPYHASGVRVEGLQVWRGAHSAKATLVTAEDVVILAPGVPAPQGTPNWLISPGNGTLLAAGSIIANGISDDEGATLAALSVAGYNTGALRQASASQFADAHGNAIATANASAVDLDGLDRVFDTGRYRPGAESWPTPRPLIGHAELSGVVTHGRAGIGTIDHVTIDTFAARPFAISPTGAAVKTGAFLRDAASALALGDASITDLHMVDDKTHVVGTISHVDITGYGDGALGRFSLGGLSLSNHGTATATIGHLQLAGFTATKLLHMPADTSMDDRIAAAGSGAVRVSSLAMSQVAVKSPEGTNLALASFSETITGDTPVHTTISVQGLTVPADTTPDLADMLRPLAVDPLLLDLDEDGSFDFSSGESTINKMTLTAEGLGSLSLSGHFTNLPRGGVTSDDAWAEVQKVGIGAFTLRFSNDTLVQRIIAMFAKQSGKTPDEIADQGKAAFAFLATALAPGQADVGDQVAAFFAAPKTVTITAAPAAPIPVSAFAGPTLTAAQAALNIHLSAQ